MTEYDSAKDAHDSYYAAIEAKRLRGDTARSFLDGRVVLHPGDCLEVLARLPENSVDAVVTDPPYHLTSIVKRFGAEGAAQAKRGATGAYQRAASGFMGKQWDGGDIAFRVETWAAVLRVLKPGGHMVAFSGTRTYHRMACAIEDAGFEIRDQIGWAFGSGFPKSHDVSKGVDKAAGHWRGKAGAVTIESQVAKGTEYERTDKGEPVTDAAREWQGWGTALKPAWEPICLARKPLSEKSVAANVLKHGTGAVNIDGCRVPGETRPLIVPGDVRLGVGTSLSGSVDGSLHSGVVAGTSDIGRWPANLIHDGSEEVLAAFPDSKSGGNVISPPSPKTAGIYGDYQRDGQRFHGHADDGSAARFFYTAKADSEDRLGSKHPTVKPLDLKQYLCRLVCPPGGTILDPFAGTGTTGEAAWREGFNAVLIEREPEYCADIGRRMDLVLKPTKRAAVAKSKNKLMGAEGTPLFGGEAA